MMKKRVVLCVLSVVVLLSALVIPCFAYSDTTEMWWYYVEQKQAANVPIDGLSSISSSRQYGQVYGDRKLGATISYYNSNANLSDGQKWSTRPIGDHIPVLNTVTDKVIAADCGITMRKAGADTFYLYGDLKVTITSISGGYHVLFFIQNTETLGTYHRYNFAVDWLYNNGSPILANRSFTRQNSSGNSYSICDPTTDDYFFQIDLDNLPTNNEFLSLFLATVCSFNYDETMITSYSVTEYSQSLVLWQRHREAGFSDGYENGYADGGVDGVVAAEKGVELVTAVVETPVNVLSEWLSFEILGINVFSFIIGLFSVALVIVVVKKVKSV